LIDCFCCWINGFFFICIFRKFHSCFAHYVIHSLAIFNGIFLSPERMTLYLFYSIFAGLLFVVFIGISRFLLNLLFRSLFIFPRMFPLFVQKSRPYRVFALVTDPVFFKFNGQT
jgi:hypothetical protein